jgi:hypothetical protein
LTTPLTSGQKAAKNGAGGVLNLKVKQTKDAFGKALDQTQIIDVNKQITQLKFVEIQGNGAGAYVTGGIK